MAINNFDVLKRMSVENKRIWLAPTNNPVYHHGTEPISHNMESIARTKSK